MNTSSPKCIPLEERSCDCCGGTEFDEVWSYSHVARTKNDRYEFNIRNVVCRYCGFAFVSPAPSQQWLDRYYEDAYSKYAGQPLASSIDARLSVLKRYGAPSSRFLEVGSNRLSTFFALCTEYFESAHSAELNNEADSEFADLENIPNESIDLLAHYYVLEHVADIKKFLKKCYSILADNGIMVCEVPNIAAYKDDIADLIFWEHLSHFSERTLELIAGQCGFETVLIEREGCSYPTGVLAVFRKAAAFGAKLRVQSDTEEYQRAKALMTRSLQKIGQFNERMELVRAKISKHALGGEKVCIWGANDIMRRLVPSTLASDKNVMLVDDDVRKASYMDCAVVHQPEGSSAWLSEAVLFVITSDRVKELILSRIGKLIGRAVPDSRVEVIDWNYRFESDRPNIDCGKGDLR
jgi:hypothetical protein